ncbi:MAG: STAS domain-containing protein, partial [Proteobacteria bacterium]|nr:STAS domain-containing protein [Pseudomonadota bacterium]
MERSEQETRAHGLPAALGEALTVQAAPGIKDWLLAALADGGPARLDLGSVEEVDLTGLQLLCAAHR